VAASSPAAASTWTRRIGAALQRLLLPEACPWCGRLRDATDRDALGCPTCRAQVRPVTEPFCHRCGVPLDGGVMPVTCARCLQDPPHFDHLRAPVVYDDIVARAVKSVKFDRRLDRTRGLARVLFAVHTFGMRWEEYDAVVPVPLFDERLGDRRFNQALELARALPEARRLAIRPAYLRRVHQTERQMELASADRAANVKGAFATPPGLDLHGRRILLIDDVATTGATLSECARALKRAGAAQVDAACVARAVTW